jgi:hypothetical protein
MAKKNTQDEDELLPTPEQAQAYAERARAAIALARFDRFCASLPASQMSAHPTQAGCIVLPNLGQSMVAVECGGEVGIGVPALHANWIEDFPFSCIAVTANDLFFVTKGFAWFGVEVPSIGISLGALIPGALLARLCQQKSVNFFTVEGDMIHAPGGTLLRDQRPVLVYLVPDNISIIATREHYESLANLARVDTQSVLTSHFLG